MVIFHSKFSFMEEDSLFEDSEDSSSSLSLSETFVKAERGLPVHIQKILLEDIEAAGGLGVCNLPRICNKRVDIYGNPNSKRRRAVRNKVARWKKLKERQYSRLLEQLGLPESSSNQFTPSRTTSTNQRTADKKENRTSMSAKKMSSPRARNLPKLDADADPDDYYGEDDDDSKLLLLVVVFTS